MIDRELENKEKEVVDNLVKVIDANKEKFYYNYSNDCLTLADNNRDYVVQVPYNSKLQKVNYKAYFYIYDTSFRVIKGCEHLEVVCDDVFNLVETKRLESKKQKELAKLDEVYMLITDLIYRRRG